MTKKKQTRNVVGWALMIFGIILFAAPNIATTLNIPLSICDPHTEYGSPGLLYVEGDHQYSPSWTCPSRTYQCQRRVQVTDNSCTRQEYWEGVNPGLCFYTEEQVNSGLVQCEQVHLNDNMGACHPCENPAYTCGGEMNTWQCTLNSVTTTTLSGVTTTTLPGDGVEEFGKESMLRVGGVVLFGAGAATLFTGRKKKR